jgi:3-oxoacyl-[acyl-carrier protein] reductase
LKRTAIVSGGTKGLGRETALAFARAGFYVLALYSSDETAAQEFNAALAEAHGQGLAVQHDVCSEDATIWDRPEIREADNLTLVHNACAAFTPVPMHHLRWADFENNFFVAVKGAWLCSQPLVRLMLKKGRGTIVTVLTSAVEAAPPKGFAAYLTAKHALRGFTLALAAEYAGRGVKIFSVSPGYMETSLTERWDARLRDAIRSNAGRITVPAIAAGRIVALVDEAIPGQGENYPL